MLRSTSACAAAGTSESLSFTLGHSMVCAPPEAAGVAVPDGEAEAVPVPVADGDGEAVPVPVLDGDGEPVPAVAAGSAEPLREHVAKESSPVGLSASRPMAIAMRSMAAPRLEAR